MNSDFEKRASEKKAGVLRSGLFLGVVVLLSGLAWNMEAAVVITPDQRIVMGESGLNEVIPDGGVRTVGAMVTGYTHLPGTTYEISVSFKLVADPSQADAQLRYMVSGDYRVLLRHGSGVSTPDTVSSFLLKNVGSEYVTPQLPQLGYWDGGGLDITLEDAATNPIQAYRTVVTGDHMTEFSGMLGGKWRPYEFMGSLGEGDPNGRWDLVVGDDVLGGQANLQSWSITLKPVPEPGSASLVALGLVTLLSRKRRCRR